MLMTRCRQLPDGEELVWDEESTPTVDGFDPREKALVRRGQALAQWVVRKGTPSSERAPVVARVKAKAEWR